MMRKLATGWHPESLPAIWRENQSINPNLDKRVARARREENQNKVSKAPFSERISSQVKTLVKSKIESPIRAVSVAETPIQEAVAQKKIITTNERIMIHSGRDKGPISSSFPL